MKYLDRMARAPKGAGVPRLTKHELIVRAKTLKKANDRKVDDRKEPQR